MGACCASRSHGRPKCCDSEYLPYPATHEYYQEQYSYEIGHVPSPPCDPGKPCDGTLPEGWATAVDQHGRTYFYHVQTQQTTWTIPGDERANWEVDQRGWEAPQPSASAWQSSHSPQHVAPRTVTEQAIQRIWGDALGMEASHVSCSADFFELGGSSLTAVVVIQRLRSELGCEDLSIALLLEARSICRLAQLITSDGDLGPQGNEPIEAAASQDDSESSWHNSQVPAPIQYDGWAAQPSAPPLSPRQA